MSSKPWTLTSPRGSFGAVGSKRVSWKRWRNKLHCTPKMSPRPGQHRLADLRKNGCRFFRDGEINSMSLCQTATAELWIRQKSVWYHSVKGLFSHLVLILLVYFFTLSFLSQGSLYFEWMASQLWTRTGQAVHSTGNSPSPSGFYLCQSRTGSYMENMTPIINFFLTF